MFRVEKQPDRFAFLKCPDLMIHRNLFAAHALAPIGSAGTAAYPIGVRTLWSGRRGAAKSRWPQRCRGQSSVSILTIEAP
jgi:hypothetical protein